MTQAHVINTAQKLNNGKILIPEIYFVDKCEEFDQMWDENPAIDKLELCHDFISQFVGSENWEVVPEPFFEFESKKGIYLDEDNNYILAIVVTEAEYNQYKKHLLAIGKEEKHIESYMKAGFDVNAVWIEEEL